MNRKIGFFDWDEHSLPVFRYTGDLPFHAVDKAGNDTHLPEDPWFLLGNYQLLSGNEDTAATQTEIKENELSVFFHGNAGFPKQREGFDALTPFIAQHIV